MTHKLCFSSVATCANWLFNILFSQVSNLAIENTQWRYYILFICLNAIDFIAIALFFPETKGALNVPLLLYCLFTAFSGLGKSLEEMAQVFGDEVVLSGSHGSEKLDEKEDIDIEHA